MSIPHCLFCHQPLTTKGDGKKFNEHGYSQHSVYTCCDEEFKDNDGIGLLFTCFDMIIYYSNMRDGFYAHNRGDYFVPYFTITSKQQLYNKLKTVVVFS